MTEVSVSLGANKYGKAENRVVRIVRDSARHEIVDLNVTSQLRGAALASAYLTGDNSMVVATDTQKNTVFAFAKEHGIRSPEEFLLSLADHFTSSFDWIEGGLFQAEQYAWERILVDGVPHDHSFVRQGQGTRLATVQSIDGSVHVTGGVKTDGDAIDDDLLAEFRRLLAAGKALAIADTHDVERLAGGQHMTMARTRMVRMAMGDQRLVDRTHRIDIEPAYRAEEALRGGVEQGVWLHGQQDSEVLYDGQRAEVCC